MYNIYTGLIYVRLDLVIHPIYILSGFRNQYKHARYAFFIYFGPISAARDGGVYGEVLYGRFYSERQVVYSRSSDEPCVEIRVLRYGGSIRIRCPTYKDVMIYL